MGDCAGRIFLSPRLAKPGVGGGRILRTTCEGQRRHPPTAWYRTTRSARLSQRGHAHGDYCGNTFSLFGQCTRASKGPGSPLPGRKHPSLTGVRCFLASYILFGKRNDTYMCTRGLHLPYSFRFLNILTLSN